MSAIEWTDQTWNPATGCTKVSPGCDNCYAEKMSKRLMLMGQKKYKNNFTYTEHPDELNKPFTWKKPKMIFVNSMSDLFHKDATDEFIFAVFDTMRIAKHHTYQILTKRPLRMKQTIRKYLKVYGGLDTMPNHIWFGVSVENNQTTWRITLLRDINCSVRFISFEPLLEKIEKPNLEKIDWVIVGGESGPNARPIKEDWIKYLKDCCDVSGSTFFFKQWGGRYPKEKGNLLNGKKYQEFPRRNQNEY